MLTEIFQHVFEYFTERTPRSHFEHRETSLVWNYKYAGVILIFSKIIVILVHGMLMVSHNLFFLLSLQMLNSEGFRQGICCSICGQAQFLMQPLMLSKVADQLRFDLLELQRYDSICIPFHKVTSEYFLSITCIGPVIILSALDLQSTLKIQYQGNTCF